MLSDEEKQAIEYLKIEYEKLMKEDNIFFPLYKSDAKRLIDIIEKQQKEIEELKNKNKKYTIHFTDKQYSDAIKLAQSVAISMFEDKIKAKIKEISKEWAEGELDGEWYEFMKYHLESLLGKE